MEGFGDRLRLAAKARAGNVKAFAELRGMDPGQMDKWVRGVKRPGLESLLQILGGDINGDWLLTGRGSMDIPEEEEEMELGVDGPLDAEGRLLRPPSASVTGGGDDALPHLLRMQEELNALLALFVGQ